MDLELHRGTCVSSSKASTERSDSWAYSEDEGRQDSLSKDGSVEDTGEHIQARSRGGTAYSFR